MRQKIKETQSRDIHQLFILIQHPPSVASPSTHDEILTSFQRCTNNAEKWGNPPRQLSLSRGPIDRLSLRIVHGQICTTVFYLNRIHTSLAGWPRQTKRPHTTFDMSQTMLQTPQRPTPGGFYSTPLPNRASSSDPRQSSTNQQGLSSQAQQQQLQQQQQQQLTRSADGEVAQAAGQRPRPHQPEMTLAERAARSINACLNFDAAYPDLDSYVGRKLCYIKLHRLVAMLTFVRGDIIGLRAVQSGAMATFPEITDLPDSRSAARSIQSSPVEYKNGTVRLDWCSVDHD